MPGELYQIYANKTAINNKRTILTNTGTGTGFYDDIYWSSREYSSDSEYFVLLDTGDIGYGSKNYYIYVLGFLALEY